MTQQIFISIGSNIERDKHVRAGLNALFATFGELSVSRVYESEAVGFAGTHFLNLVVGARTDMTVEQVCQVLKKIEQDNGRIRGEKKFAPRTLDLDLLLYGELVTQETVELPRDEIEHNAFVLQPLAEIAPNDLHPVTGKSFQDMWQAYDKSKQNLWPINFAWSPEPA